MGAWLSEAVEFLHEKSIGRLAFGKKAYAVNIKYASNRL
jgi:hypothetical protein